MEVKINLDSGENLEEAEDKLYKALKGKKKAKENLGERYADPVLNEFHDMILDNHLEVLEDIKEQIKHEVQRVTPRQHL